MKSIAYADYTAPDNGLAVDDQIVHAARSAQIHFEQSRRLPLDSAKVEVYAHFAIREIIRQSAAPARANYRPQLEDMYRLSWVAGGDPTVFMVICTGHEPHGGGYGQITAMIQPRPVYPLIISGKLSIPECALGSVWSPDA